MREAYRLQKNDLQQYLKQQGKNMSVFFLYQGKKLPQYEEVYEKMGTVLKRLIKLSNENTESHP